MFWERKNTKETRTAPPYLINRHVPDKIKHALELQKAMVDYDNHLYADKEMSSKIYEVWKVALARIKYAFMYYMGYEKGHKSISRGNSVRRMSAIIKADKFGRWDMSPVIDWQAPPYVKNARIRNHHIKEISSLATLRSRSTDGTEFTPLRSKKPTRN